MERCQVVNNTQDKKNQIHPRDAFRYIERIYVV
jgi:hypothetical protein